MTPLFADSFYWFALTNPRDRAHARATAYATVAVPIVTTAWVVTELADGFCRAASRSKFQRILNALRNDPFLIIVPAEQGLMDRGIALYLARLDKDWSLTDCISFVVMGEMGLTDALTADHHFEQAGFNALLK